MALYPNGRHLTRSPGRHFGPGPGLGVVPRLSDGARLGRFTALADTASTPDGYGLRALVPPLTAGGMSALVRVAQVDGAASLLQGAPMEGSASVASLLSSAGLSLVAGLSGTASVLTLTGEGLVLSLTVGLDGSASWALSGTAALALIVPFEGAGSVAQVTGTADLRGILSMVGEWTPYTELSPESLARSVWDAVAAQYNDAGTMGAKLNTASSGGVDLNALAQAVWEYATRTLTAGAALTAEQVASAVLAAAQTTPIHADTKKMNGATLTGNGTAGDLWRGA